MRKYYMGILFFIFIGKIGYGEVRFLVLGDSLSAGYEIGEDKSYVTLVKEKLKQENELVSIYNGSISGSTSSTALPRLRFQLARDEYDVLVLQLGANDGLRGYDLEEMENNLKKAIDYAKEKGLKIFLVGMYIPSNYGKKYTEDFQRVFVRLSKMVDIYMPFLLKSVYKQEKWMLKDNIHPNEEGHKLIAEDIFSYFKQFLKK